MKKTPKGTDIIKPEDRLMAMGQFLLYTTEDGKKRIEVRLEDETLWLNQIGLAELFQTTVPNINIHLKNIYGEGELSEEGTIKEYLIVRQEGELYDKLKGRQNGSNLYFA